MTPKPLSVPVSEASVLAIGDTITIEGMFNRPPTRSGAWWAMLIFGPPFAARHFWRLFRRTITSPFNFLPTSRRGLFEPRQLQKFKIDKHYVNTEGA